MEKLKYLFAALGGLLVTFGKMYGALFIAVALAMCFDFITGIIAAKVSGEGFNSQKAKRGALKKGMLLGALLFGIFLDYVLPMAAVQVGFKFDMTHLLFSSIIGFYIVFTECISVCENFYRCCPDTFPKWIVKFLTIGKDQLDKLGEQIEEDQDEEDLH